MVTADWSMPNAAAGSRFRILLALPNTITAAS
jgi:hypothetical protein